MVNLLRAATCLLLSCSTAGTAFALPNPLVDAGSRPPRPKDRIPPPLSVGDYALQKVLYDAEDIFGYYDYPPDPKKKSRINMSRCEWLSALPDSVPLHQLNIPGTHASATWSFSNTSSSSHYNSDPANAIPPASHIQCQTTSLIDSLNSGIRFLDLTFGLDPLGESLVFWHDTALLSPSPTATLETVLFGFYTWLSSHPSEVVFLSLKYTNQHETIPLIPQSEIDELIYNVLTSRPARRYIHQSKTLPSHLGSCRGKIILLRHFDLPHVTTHCHLPGLHLPPHLSPPTNSSHPFTLPYGSRYHRQKTLHISNWHDLSPLHGSSPTSHISSKLRVVESHLKAAAKGATGCDYTSDYYYSHKNNSSNNNNNNNNKTTKRSCYHGWHGPEVVQSDDGELWITFASGQNNRNAPIPITPEVLALGSKDTEDDDGYRASVNKGVCRILRKLRGKRLGIIVVDFWEGGEHGDLIGAILGDWGSNGRYGGREGEFC